MKNRRSFAAAVVLASSLALVVLLAVPSRRDLVLAVYELVVGSLAIVALVAWFAGLRLREQSAFDPRPSGDEPTRAIAELDRIDRIVVLGCATEFDLHFRLRPLLRELAAERLQARHGIALDDDPTAARALLGDELWEVARADRGRERPSPSGRGMSSAQLERAVARLEAV